MDRQAARVATGDLELGWLMWWMCHTQRIVRHARGKSLSKMNPFFLVFFFFFKLQTWKVQKCLLSREAVLTVLWVSPYFARQYNGGKSALKQAHPLFHQINSRRIITLPTIWRSKQDMWRLRPRENFYEEWRVAWNSWRSLSCKIKQPFFAFQRTRQSLLIAALFFRPCRKEKKIEGNVVE